MNSALSLKFELSKTISSALSDCAFCEIVIHSVFLLPEDGGPGGVSSSVTVGAGGCVPTGVSVSSGVGSVVSVCVGVTITTVEVGSFIATPWGNHLCRHAFLQDNF